MDSITLGIRESRVVLVNKGTQRALSFSWRAAECAGRSLAHKGRGVEGPEKEIFGNIAIHRDDVTVVVSELATGQVFLTAFPQAAIEIGYKIIAQARKLEEQAKAEAVAYDQAILQRIGAPFGLTTDSRIQAEAGKEAAWNSDLRRYISGKNLRQEQMGSPSVLSPGGITSGERFGQL